MTDHSIALQPVRELDPAGLWATYRVAVNYKLTGNLSEAIGHFARCTELEPRFLPARMQLAAIFQEQGNHQSALSEYSVAIDSCVGNDELLPDLYFAVGDLYREQGRYDLALEAYESAVELVRAESGSKG